MSRLDAARPAAGAARCKPGATRRNPI